MMALSELRSIFVMPTLNIMFKQIANVPFNNKVFKCAMISAMNEQMRRLYEAAEALKGVSGKSAVAHLLNQSPQTLNNWEERGISNLGLLLAEENIGCRAIWVKSGAGTMTGSNVVQLQPKADGVEIKQYCEVGGAMGHAVMLRDQPGEIQSWRVTTEWAKKNIPSHTGMENLVIVTGFGHSMRGMFNPGDPLLVDRGVRGVEFDAVYFFRVGNEGFIKTLQRVPGMGLRAISKNPEFETWTITPEMDFQVLGRVLKVWQSEVF